MSEPAPEVRPAQGAPTRGNARVRRLGIAFAACVGLPTALSAAYDGIVATPQYESVAVLTVEPAELQQGGGRTKFGGSETSARDLELLRRHALSRATLETLSRDRGLVEHYQDRTADFWSRLDADAGSEETHAYFLDKVSIDDDGRAATLTLRVRAFSARRARDFAAAIVDSSARLLQRLSERSRRDVVDSAARQEAEARAAFVAAKAAAGGEPPEARANGAGLELELARERLGAAMRAVEEARVEGARRQRSLAVIAEPSLPDEPSYPRRLWNVATVLVTSLVLLCVLLLLGAAAREHARF